MVEVCIFGLFGLRLSPLRRPCPMAQTHLTSEIPAVYPLDGTMWNHHLPGTLSRSLIDGRRDNRNHESEQDRNIQRLHNIHGSESSAILGNQTHQNWSTC